MFPTNYTYPEPMTSSPLFIQLNRYNEAYNTVSYREFYDRVSNIQLKISDLKTEQPLVLIFNDEIEFMVVFVACQFSGHIAVPTSFPNSKRHFERVIGIMDDCGAEIILCEDTHENKIKKGIGNYKKTIHILSSSALKSTVSNEVKVIQNRKENKISFIQYTSGSTGMPKGVVISQENLKTNQEIIKRTFKTNEHSKILSWLPFYHDMGLIGNLLHALYTHSTCYLIKPLDFMQHPGLWMEAVSKYRITHTGGPNFSFDHLLSKLNVESNIDLSCLEVLYNGSEPIKSGTIQGVYAKLAAHKLKQDTLFTCYGLAEATLLVAAGSVNGDEPVISSGSVCESIDIKIVDPDDLIAGDGVEGEICISGKSNTEGYWNKDNEAFFISINNKKHIRSGDIGFLKGRKLYVTGRIKEIIILNGKKYFPYDLENEISNQSDHLESNSVVVTSDSACENSVFIFAELKRSADPKLHHDLACSINRTAVSFLGIEPVNILLANPRRLPRTSSGKLQRKKCLEDFLSHELEITFDFKNTQDLLSLDLVDELKRYSENYLKNQRIEDLENYIKRVFISKLHLPPGTLDTGAINLFELGIDSLKIVEISNAINTDLKIQIEFVKLFNINNVTDFVNYIHAMYWLKNGVKQNNEIII